MSNISDYPPEVPDSTYGTSWNDVKEERRVTITLKTVISTSFPCPSQYSEEEVLESIKQIVEEDLKKTSEYYETVDIELEEIKEKKKKEPYKVAVWWSVEDFAGMAEEQFELMTYYSENSPKSVQERAKRILSTCKNWKDYYDESKFEEALDSMIHKHDAEYGITWESVKFYLEEMCRKEEREEKDE